MLKRRNYLSVLMLAASVGVGIWLAGCSQSIDVATSITSTVLKLDVERLPTTPPGMIYELWVGDTTGGASSLGKFFYNYDSVKFYDDKMKIPELSHERSNEFVFNDDILRYSLIGSKKIWKYPFVFVTINRINDVNAGPVMLIDRVANPDDKPIQLVFPMSDSLWSTTARVNFQAVSGRGRLQNIGKGVWFSSYLAVRDTIRDTLRPDDLYDPEKIDTTSASSPTQYIDSILDTPVNRTAVRYGKDTLFLHDTYNIFGDSIWSRDTVWHEAFPFEKIWKTDLRGSIKPGVDTTRFPRKFKNKRWSFTPKIMKKQIWLDIFTQDNYGFPNYGSVGALTHPTGWRYKGWVVSPYVPTSAVGSFTPPAWKYKSDSAGSTYNFIPGDEGGLISTGTFYNVNASDDDGNFYGLEKPDRSLYPISPPYPGGDFIDANKVRSAFGVDTIQFLPDTAAVLRGTVFITLEPENYTSTSTNFPLIMMYCPVPSSKSEAYFATIDSFPGKLPAINTKSIKPVQFSMTNSTSHVHGSLIGFPQISVTIQRR